MPTYVSPIKTSGTHRWSNLFADTLKELERMARRLHVEVKEDGRGYHADVTEHQRQLALRYGAREEE